MLTTEKEPRPSFTAPIKSCTYLSIVLITESFSLMFLNQEPHILVKEKGKDSTSISVGIYLKKFRENLKNLMKLWEMINTS